MAISCTTGIWYRTLIFSEAQQPCRRLPSPSVGAWKRDLWLTNRQIDRPSVRPTKQPTERQTDRPIGAWKSYFQTFKKIVTDRRTNRIEYSKSRYIPLPALLTQAEAETCFRSVVFFYLCPWPFMSVCRSVGCYVGLSVIISSFTSLAPIGALVF